MKKYPEHLAFETCESIGESKVFQGYCLDVGLIRKIIDIFDKGCTLSLEAAKLDQICRYPHFAKSDTQFSRRELISSGSVRCLRSGSERNVKVMK